MNKKIETSRGWCSTKLLSIDWPKQPKGEERLCPLCGEDVAGRKAHLLINNYIMFPNCVVHEDCAPEITEEIVDRIHDNYLEFKEFEKKFKHWMRFV